MFVEIPLDDAESQVIEVARRLATGELLTAEEVARMVETPTYIRQVKA